MLLPLLPCFLSSLVLLLHSVMFIIAVLVMILLPRRAVGVARGLERGAAGTRHIEKIEGGCAGTLPMPHTLDGCRRVEDKGGSRRVFKSPRTPLKPYVSLTSFTIVFSIASMRRERGMSELRL